MLVPVWGMSHYPRKNRGGHVTLGRIGVLVPVWGMSRHPRKNRGTGSGMGYVTSP